MKERMRTIAQRQADVELSIRLFHLEIDVEEMKRRDALIPADWHKLDGTAPVRPRKKKVTLGLDEDVARWFHRLGAGYHGRINAVLRTYMLALISKEVLSRGDWDLHGNEIWGKAKPKEKEE